MPSEGSLPCIHNNGLTGFVKGMLHEPVLRGTAADLLKQFCIFPSIDARIANPVLREETPANEIPRTAFTARGVNGSDSLPARTASRILLIV